MQEKEGFHSTLQSLMDEYVHHVYDRALHFPKEEIFGVTSQLRRSALSVPLNYIEGYARRQKKTYRHFLEIAYGSLKESRYLIEFAYKRKYMQKDDSEKLLALADRIGAMIWGVISQIKE